MLVIGHAKQNAVREPILEAQILSTSNLSHCGILDLYGSIVKMESKHSRIQVKKNSMMEYRERNASISNSITVRIQSR